MIEDGLNAASPPKVGTARAETQRGRPRRLIAAQAVNRMWLLTSNKTSAFSVRLGACVQRQSDDKCLLSRCSFASLQCFDDFLGGRFLSRKRLKFTNMCHCPSASLWCSIHCMISNYLRSIVSLEVFFTRKTLMKPPSSCLTTDPNNVAR